MNCVRNSEKRVDVSVGSVFKASVQHDCLFDISHCLVQTTKQTILKRFYISIQGHGKTVGQMREGDGEEEADGNRWNDYFPRHSLI